MILSQENEAMNYQGKEYYIGQRVFATDESDYAGLLGTIVEIRDGEDKITESEGPSLCCTFERPQMPCDIKHLEDAMSELFGEPKKIDDIDLEMINMAPSMIDPIEAKQSSHKIYVLTESWTHSYGGGSSYIYLSSLGEAKKQMRLRFNRMIEDGFLSRLLEQKGIIVDSFDNSYSAYVEDNADEEYYEIAIAEQSLNFDSLFAKEVFAKSAYAATSDDGISYDTVIACLEEELEHLEKYRGNKQKEDESYQFVISQLMYLARENKIRFSVMEKVSSLITNPTKGVYSAYLEAIAYCKRRLIMYNGGKI